MPRPQDMIFTLYGDYIIHRGGEVWTGSLIKLLGHLGMSEGAVRSALSRMSRKGWLKSRRIGNKSYYSLTAKSVKLLEEGAERIFEPPQVGHWDGRWYLLTYSIPEDKRRLRNKLRNNLIWMGFGLLGNGLWVSPYDLRQDVKKLVESLDIQEYVELFEARHLGFAKVDELVARCWNLDELNDEYAVFIAKYRPKYLEHLAISRGNGDLPTGECFARRFMLIHEYRRFPFIDPHLPSELLPPNWLGDEAIKLFQAYHKLLTAPANEFVDSVFEKAPPR